jgi:hypothetical protein
VIQTTDLRFATTTYDWTACEACLGELFSELASCDSFLIVRQLLEKYIHVFADKIKNLEWIPRFLSCIRDCPNITLETLNSFPLYDESPDWGNNALLNAAISLNKAHIAWIEGAQNKVVPLLLSSIANFMAFARYRYWTKKQPQLEAYWLLDPDSLENILARLSFAKDPIINDHMRDIWLSISDEIDNLNTATISENKPQS